MTIRAAQPLPLEWFGGLNSSLPTNDLPPFAAARADNCIFPGSSVGSRGGITSILSTTGPAINSLVPLRVSYPTKGIGPVLLRGKSNGSVTLRWLGTPAAEQDVTSLRTLGPVITTGTQFYERGLLFLSEANGYGEYATGVGASFGGVLRFAEPLAPTLTVNVGAGAMTAGTHTAALSATFTDGSETALGQPTSALVAAGDALTIAWDAARVPTGAEVASVSVWLSLADDPTRLRRIASIGPDWYTFQNTASDQTLVGGNYELAEYQPRLRSPKYPALGVTYAGRIGYFGEKHRAVAGWGKGGSLGTDFGLDPFPYAALTPGGWTVISGAGGLAGFYNYRIRFDGATVARTRLQNVGTVLPDLVGVARLQSVGWSGEFAVRLRAAKSAGLANASVKFGITGTTGSTDRTVTAAELSTSMQDFVLTCSVSGGSTDLRLFVEGIGPGVLNEDIYITVLECYDPNNVSHRSTVWWTRPLALRSIDTLTGGQTFGADDGETVQLGFEWQGRFYVAKDSSLWVTQQQTNLDPAEWPIEKVSELAGACGRRAIADGPDFKVMINRKGAWLFQGTAPGPADNLAVDIPVEWEAVNWAQAWQIWGAVDAHEKRVYIGVPTGAATACDKIYVLDYSDGFGAGEGDGGRKWSVWLIAANGGCIGQRDGASVSELWVSDLGGGAARIGYLDPTATSDWGGTEISWVYETGRIGAEDGALSLYRRVAVNVEGSGLFTIAIVKADGTLVSLPSPTLYTPMRGTQHILCNVVDERVALRFGKAGATAKALLHRVALWMARHPFGPYRPRTP